MKSIIKIISFTVIILIAFTIYPSQSDAKGAKGLGMDKRVITIPEELLGDQLTGVKTGQTIPLFDNDITLSGLSDSTQTYYQVPLNELQKGSYLTLFVEYSELLLVDSSITVSIDDRPIKSFKIDTKKTQMELKVNLDDQAREQGFHNVTITYEGIVSDNICVNIDSQSAWLTVFSESNVYLAKTDMKSRDNVLADFPYPFIQVNQENPIQTTIVVPEKPSEDILSAALKVSSYLNNEMNTSDVVPIVHEDSLEKISNNIIVIGAEGEWKGIIKDLLASAKLNVSNNNMLLSNYYLASPDATRQALFITGKEDGIIKDNINIITKPEFVEQLSGNELSISELPKVSEEELKDKHRLRDFDVPNLTLTGNDRKTLNYFYSIPTYVDLYTEAILNLRLKVSETLMSKSNPDEDAELVVFINQIPHSVGINNLIKTNQEGIYEVQLPVQSRILREAGFLSISFQANGLTNADYCEKSNDDEWIFVQSNSYFTFSTGNTIGDFTFSNWPAPFVSTNVKEKTLIVYPSETTDKLISNLQLLTNTLGERALLDGLQFVTDKSLEQKMLEENHVIVVGALKLQKELDAVEDRLLIKRLNKDQFNVAEYGFINETSDSVAWIQKSLWNDEKAMLVFSEVKETNDAKVTTKSIISFINQAVVDTNIIVENKNGEIYSHQLKNTIDDTIIEEDKSISETIKDEISRNTWIVYAFIGFVLLSMTVLFFYIRQRK